MVAPSERAPSASVPPIISVWLSGRATTAPLASAALTGPTGIHAPMACGACASNAPDAVAARIAKVAHAPKPRIFPWLVAITVFALDVIELSDITFVSILRHTPDVSSRRPSRLGWSMAAPFSGFGATVLQAAHRSR